MTSFAQTPVEMEKNAALNLYLNCGDCFEEYIKTEIKFVNYVYDRLDADVDLLITIQEAGAGGTEYFLFFIGLNKFTHVNDTLKYIEKAGSAQDETRKELVQLIKIGLMRYIGHTSSASRIQITSNETKHDETTLNINNIIDDKWKSWVFNINGYANLNGEKSSLSQNYSGKIIANKTTEKIKIELGLKSNYGENRFTYGDITINSYTKSQLAYLQVIKSISKHWSFGVFANTGNGTYNNLEFYATASPALEYNVFPYTQSQRKSFTITWDVAFKHNEYTDTTIYEEVEEDLIQNRLNISLSATQPWGSVSVTLFGSHYLHDFEKNRLSLYGSTDLRIFKGFSFNIFMGYELVHDQIALPKGGASETELLLHRKEIETNYFFSFGTGLVFRFGSKYNNVVNSRLNIGE